MRKRGEEALTEEQILSIIREVLDGDVTNYACFEPLQALPIDTVFNCAANVKHFSNGTDIEDSNSTVDFWFERKDAKFLLRILFLAGVAVKLPGYVTYGK